MKYQKMIWISALSISCIFLQSCAKDSEAIILDQSNLIEEEDQDQTPGGDVASISSNLVTRWMELYLELEQYAGGMRPNASARALAYVHLAAYETAVPGMKDFISNSQLIQGLNITDPINLDNIDWQIALNTCYAKVTDHFLINVPAQLKNQIASFEENRAERLSRNKSESVIASSKAWGTYIANQVIAFSQTDLEAEAQILAPQPLSYEPPTGDGYWSYSAEPERALFPYWSKVRTFVISSEETSSLPPLAYSEAPNSPYFKEMQEVYLANNEAKKEQGEALWIAEFWSDDVETLTFSPPARQFSIAKQLISEHRMNLEEALHLNMKLGFSLNDAAVSTWDDKYKYMVMRPSVFIHEFIDPTYQTNLYRLIPWPNPSFPGYPSGHSCFASAAGGVFKNFFGNIDEFTDRSHQGRTEFLGSPRSFRSFEEMAKENAFSRIPLGVHIRMDCEEGLRLGYEIADAINNYQIKTQHNLTASN